MRFGVLVGVYRRARGGSTSAKPRVRFTPVRAGFLRAASVAAASDLALVAVGRARPLSAAARARLQRAPTPSSTRTFSAATLGRAASPMSRQAAAKGMQTAIRRGRPPGSTIRLAFRRRDVLLLALVVLERETGLVIRAARPTRLTTSSPNYGNGNPGQLRQAKDKRHPPPVRWANLGPEVDIGPFDFSYQGNCVKSASPCQGVGMGLTLGPGLTGPCVIHDSYFVFDLSETQHNTGVAAYNFSGCSSLTIKNSVFRLRNDTTGVMDAMWAPLVRIISKFL